jgi:hypothetical protein
MKNMQGIMLCRQPGKCCPVFKKEGRKYSISDKGQEIFFTKEQLHALYDVIQNVVK